MIQICLIGAGGRMGRLIAERVRETVDLFLVGAVEAPGSDCLGEEIVPGVRVTDQLKQAAESADVIVDFSAPTNTPEVFEMARDLGKAVVCGVTGLDAVARAAMEKTASTLPVFYSANMSLGVAVLAQAVELVARALDYDIEILDVHHGHKKDAPSGTALHFGEVAALARGWSAEAFCFDRSALKEERPQRQIGFASLRGGGVRGQHEVCFLGKQETVILRHESFSRGVFADGALRASRWIVQKPAGLYGMHDLMT